MKEQVEPCFILGMAVPAVIPGLCRFLLSEW